ncbi:hypothetical protein BpHYR1_023135 [Brachionus plicatilis]|uniref:Uncharacterized protein n=1 Tax=Brachionus plicatilis TaxID=10195 RepID=A0A3M7QGA3_BRAPC|nr:hypothetical protein BpHYR1_023135 [Brachionus plicatilis]
MNNYIIIISLLNEQMLKVARALDFNIKFKHREKSGTKYEFFDSFINILGIFFDICFTFEKKYSIRFIRIGAGII